MSNDYNEEMKRIDETNKFVKELYDRDLERELDIDDRQVRPTGPIERITLDHTNLEEITNRLDSIDRTLNAHLELFEQSTECHQISDRRLDEIEKRLDFIEKIMKENSREIEKAFLKFDTAMKIHGDRLDGLDKQLAAIEKNNESIKKEFAALWDR